MSITMEFTPEAASEAHVGTPCRVRAAQAGDRAALGELFEDHAEALYRTALKIVRNHAEAQEVVQEAYLRVMTKLDQLQFAERFSGWIHAITSRIALNRLTRDRMTYTCHIEGLGKEILSEAAPEQVAIEREEARGIRAGMGRLSAQDRATLEAFYIHGRSLREMADDFSAPIGTIKRRLHDARKRLGREVSSST